MNITPSKRNSLAFKRAYTQKEMKAYQKITTQARQKLGIKDTAAVIFDFNVPSKNGLNYGIGNLNSNENFIDFLQSMTGITRIQAAPQSELKYYSNGETIKPVTSPYSGSTFSIGKQTISLEKLATPKYGNLLDEGFVQLLDEEYNGNKVTREYKTDYDYALGENKDGAIYKALSQAFSKLKSDATNPINAEFEAFKGNIDDDVRKDILYDAISNEYHKKGLVNAADFRNWDEEDRNFFALDRDKQKQREEGLKDDIEFLTFCQFIAEKQHMETKETLNKKGIKYTGDCLVCFSDKEVWANPDCFLNGWFTGGIDPFCPETNNIQPWGSPALNYDELGEFDYNTGDITELKKVGELLYRKFKRFAKLYDGIRMDAFWQYVSPFIYTENLEGKNVENIGNKIIKIMEKAVKDNNGGTFNPDDYILELVGFNTEKGKELTKNIFPHVYSTAYAEYNENPKDLKNTKVT